MAAIQTATAAAKPNAKKTKSVAVFVEKLYEIVSSTQNTFVNWGTSGSSFIIKDVNRFSKEVLSKNFKSSQFSSFVRQLHFYGWGKASKPGSPVLEFKHEFFKKGRKDLLPKIQRRTSEQATNQKKKLDEIGSKISQMTNMILQLQKSVAEAANSASSANERAMRAERLAENLRAENDSLRARVQCLESCPKTEHKHSDDDLHLSGNVNQPNQEKVDLTVPELEFWDQLYDVDFDMGVAGKPEEQIFEQEQNYSDKTQRRLKRQRVETGRYSGIVEPLPLNYSQNFSQSWAASAATAQVAALTAAASAVGALPMQNLNTKDSTPRESVSQYQTLIPSVLSQVGRMQSMTMEIVQ